MNENFMRIYVTETNSVFELNSDIFESISEWLVFLNDWVKPIMDKKVQLGLNATHQVSELRQFEGVVRYLEAGQLILGAMLVIATRTYRIQNPNSPISRLPDAKMLKTDEVSSFMKNGDLDRVLGSDFSTIKLVRDEALANDYLLEMAQAYSKAIFNKDLYGNVEQLLKVHYKKSFFDKIESATSDGNDTFLKIELEDSKDKILIYFNAGDEQMKLLDQWMAIPALSLRLSDTDYKTFLVSNREQFVAWFNLLRLVVESDCSYQTLIQYVKMLDDGEKYASSIEDKLKAIYLSDNTNESDRRRHVMEFCHKILNQREGYEALSFDDFTLDKLNQAISNSGGLIVFNLYE